MANISHMMDEIRNQSNFMLGSGDTVPKGVTIQHFEIIQKLLNLKIQKNTI